MEYPTTPARSAAGPDLLGWWRLLTCDIELQGSGLREPMYGVPARGYIVFASEGRMMTVIEAEGRAAPATEEECAASYRSMAAYTGTYRTEGDRWVTSVEASWNGGWTGTEQVRAFRIEHDRLFVTSEWYASPLHAGKIVRAHLVWECAEKKGPLE